MTMASIKASLFLPATVALMLGIFAIDLMTPLGVGIWALYVVPIIVTFWLGSARSVLFVTLAATVLIFVGFALSPTGITPALGLLNRSLGAGLIWFATAVLTQQRRLNLSLARERDLADAIKERMQAEATRTRLAAIVESSDDAIIGNDLNGNITDWNQGAERTFGYRAGEIVGTSTRRLIPAEREIEDVYILARIERGEHVEQFETLRQTKDGRLINVSITASPIKDGAGQVIGASNIARDITLQKAHVRELARLTRLYAAMSQINQAIVCIPARDELFQKVCQVLVDNGGFHMAWIGWHDPATQQLAPLAVSGDENDYIKSVKVYGDERPEGNGPTGLAFRSGRPYVCNDMLNNPVTLPWRPELLRRGFKASAVFPIRQKNEVRGTLSVYSEEPFFFQDKEVALLEEAANDVSFALGIFARDEERRQTDQALRSEKRFSDTMIESMPGIVYFYDSTGRFLRWNRNFEVVSGYAAEEIAEMRPLDFFQGEEKTRVEQRIAEVFAKGESSVEALFAAKDGTATPYFFTGRLVPFEGKSCLVGVGIDISESKEAEAEREKRQQAEAADRIKSAFLATMSHELRTPLNSIIGFTGIILQGLAGPLNPEQRKQLEMVRTSARHLLALVNDVLDISKIEAGQLKVGREPFDLKRSIAKVIAAITPLAEKKKLALRVEVAAELGEATSDERRFEQILLNLLSNAIKFTDRGEVALQAEQVNDFQLPGWPCSHAAVRVRIADTGIGIKANDLATLFQPFRQIDSGLSRNHDGTGLGLAICRRLAELMGGAIAAESIWAKGSVFSVTLPLLGAPCP
jgi:PAS domain S-box-containing protein